MRFPRSRSPLALIGIILASWAFIGALIMGIHSLANAAPPAEANQYRAQITREAQFQFGIPAPVPLIAAQIQQESAWNVRAQSHAGARGLMQFMPKTATWAADVMKTQADPFNPTWSIRTGIWYDRWLMDRIQADTLCDKWLFTLAAYNGGLGYVYKRQKLSLTQQTWEGTGTINPGIKPSNQRENESYGPRIAYRHQPHFVNWGTPVCLN